MTFNNPEGCRIVAGGIIPGFTHTHGCTPAGLRESAGSALTRIDRTLACHSKTLTKQDFAGAGYDDARVGTARRSRPTLRAKRSGGGWLLSAGDESVAASGVSIRDVLAKRPYQSHAMPRLAVAQPFNEAFF